MFKKGQPVTIKPEWQDAGDSDLLWVTVSDESKGRVDITPTNTGLTFTPINTVRTDMILRSK